MIIVFFHFGGVVAVLAVDVGGTKVAVALIDRQGRILRKTHQSTDLRGHVDVVSQIVEMSHDVLDGESILAVGLSVPAVIDRTTDRILWAPNLPGWENADLKGVLSERFGVPASIEYDGHAAVLGEWWGGAGRGFHSLASIVIGTGIGAGFIEDGKLWKGHNRLAGAVGWFPILTEDGVVSWEQAASGAGIVRSARRRIERDEPTCLQLDGLTAKQVFDAARQGDALACQVTEEIARYIGLGVASVISFANPQVVILGGSIGYHSDLILPSVRQTASEWAQPYAARDVLILASTLGEEAGLLGAAYSAIEQLEH